MDLSNSVTFSVKNNIGLVASTFDLLHAGHVLMLKEAKTKCNHLIAALHTDPTIERSFKNKPVQSVFERMVQLQGCRYVDEIIVYDTEQDLLNILKSYPIDLRILGEEYRGTKYTGHELGIDCYFNKRQHNFSTSELRSRIHHEESLNLTAPPSSQPYYTGTYKIKSDHDPWDPSQYPLFNTPKI